MRVDGASVERLVEVTERPLVSVFLPDRLELIKGAPALRRAHLDQYVAALWPARAATRRAYAQTLAQRNALIARIRAGAGEPRLARELGRPARAARSRADGRSAQRDRGRRRAASRRVARRWGSTAIPSSSTGPAHARRTPSSSAPSSPRGSVPISTAVSPATGRTATIWRRSAEGRDLRTYGSQGQQRLALLALLLAEREAIAARRDSPPVMLLDDVMSELDSKRRRALVDLLRATGGQSVITATDLQQVPGAERGRCDEAGGVLGAGSRRGDGGVTSGERA